GVTTRCWRGASIEATSGKRASAASRSIRIRRVASSSRCTRSNRYFAGTSSRLRSHASALPSEGARQSPRGESEPPEPTFGAFGTALRLYWLIWKKRLRNTPSHLRMRARLYLSRQAFQQRYATLVGA